MDYVVKKFIRPNTIENRQYQISLAEEAIHDNCIVILPTGLGKTTVALYVISEYLQRREGGVLFLAPTKVLTNQHHEFLKNSMTIDDIAQVTGTDTIKKRKSRWMNSIVCATPEIARNDFEREIVQASQFSLVIFDEVHRTVGDYAYSAIAKRFVGRDVRLLGMTATLPSETQKATEILSRLRIGRVAQRTEDSPDVAPYIQDTAVEWITVELPPEMIRMKRDLDRALAGRYNTLRNMGFKLDSPSLTQLLKIQPMVMQRNKAAAPALFSAIRIHHALIMLEAHGIEPFLKFCEKAREKSRGKGGYGIRALLDEDPLFSRTIVAAKEAQQKGIEHSKLKKLLGIIKKIPGKALVFASYRDTVDMVHRNLQDMGISSAILIGKAGDAGLKQKEQVETVQKFRDGQYRVLVSTRVGEEGLDISEVNHVIFYDNVPSSIRYIQRKGRTGRKDAGRLIVLIAKGTIDETYHWIGKRKIKTAGNMGNRMARLLEKNRNEPVQTGMDAFT